MKKPRHLSLKIRDGCSHNDAGLSVVVMPLVRNDLKHSRLRRATLMARPGVYSSANSATDASTGSGSTTPSGTNAPRSTSSNARSSTSSKRSAGYTVGSTSGSGLQYHRGRQRQLERHLERPAVRLTS